MITVMIATIAVFAILSAVVFASLYAEARHEHDACVEGYNEIAVALRNERRRLVLALRRTFDSQGQTEDHHALADIERWLDVNENQARQYLLELEAEYPDLILKTR